MEPPSKGAERMAHSVATASHVIGRAIIDANNHTLFLLHQAAMVVGIYFVVFSSALRRLSHGRGHVLRGLVTRFFVTSPEPLCLPRPRSNEGPLQCAAAVAIRYRQCYHASFIILPHIHIHTPWFVTSPSWPLRATLYHPVFIFFKPKMLSPGCGFLHSILHFIFVPSVCCTFSFLLVDPRTENSSEGEFTSPVAPCLCILHD